jgi:hypothetical protein
MKFAAIALLTGSLLLGAGNTAPAEREPEPKVGEVSIYLSPPRDRNHHRLELHVFPLRGVAVLRTEPNAWSGESGIVYATAIPRKSFHGSLNLIFPHLGRIVGKVTAAPGQEACGNGYGEGATFRGRIEFRGIGGRERWSATEAEAALHETCEPYEPPRGEGDVLLTNAVAREGPGFSGPDTIAFFARSFTQRRYLEFVSVVRISGGATFLATDVEWLAGRVAAERWINRSLGEARHTVSVEREPQMPPGATFKPPPPFFGTGTYDPETQELTGSLGVRFPGLTLRLARPPMEGDLTDEERH